MIETNQEAPHKFPWERLGLLLALMTTLNMLGVVDAHGEMVAYMAILGIACITCLVMGISWLCLGQNRLAYSKSKGRSVEMEGDGNGAHPLEAYDAYLQKINALNRNAYVGDDGTIRNMPYHRSSADTHPYS